MATNYFQKDPNAIEDYEFDWSDELAGDTIQSSSLTVPSGLTQVSSSSASQSVTVTVSGGTIGTTYEVVNRITTAGGRTFDASIFIEIVHTRVYTIGGRQIEQYVRLEVADDVQPFEYSIAVINRAIQQAVRWYNQMRPYQKENSFTVVKDQQLYALPSDCINVVELHYKRSDTDDIYERLSDFYPFHFTDIDSESLTIVQQGLVRAFEEYAHHFWEQVTYLTSYRSGRYVILYPPPDNSSDTVYYRYTREHTLLASDYPTIPWEDVGDFVKLVVLALDQRELSRMKRAPARYREGQTEVDYRAAIGQLRSDIDNRWQEIKDSLGSPTILQG